MKQSEYLSLCARSLSGELSDEEKQKLETWLALAPENRDLMDRVARTWLRTEPQPQPVEPDAESGWRVLEHSLGLAPVADKARKSASHGIFAWIPSLGNRKVRTTAVSFASIALVIAAAWVLKSRAPGPNIKTVVTAYRERVEVVLSDGSRVRLNSGSSLKYPDRFSGSARQVDLTGEAFFDVSHDGKPFIVMTGNAKTTVLGTRFNVWSRDDQTRLIVEHGRVRFESRRFDHAVILDRGQASRVVGEEVTSPAVSINVERLLGWLHGRLVFDKTPVPEIVRELERTFGASIELKGTELLRKTVTAEFDKPSLETVLSSLCLTLNAEYQSISGHYVIRGR
jgi:transmembrane sensor